MLAGQRAAGVLAERVGVSVVAGALLHHRHEQPTWRDRLALEVAAGNAGADLVAPGPGERAAESAGPGDHRAVRGPGKMAGGAGRPTSACPGTPGPKPSPPSPSC